MRVTLTEWYQLPIEKRARVTHIEIDSDKVPPAYRRGDVITTPEGGNMEFEEYLGEADDRRVDPRGFNK